MTNDINFLTGIKDPYLKPAKPFLTEDKRLKVIHLIQSYPMHCPLCGQLMRRNGFRKKPVTIKILPIAGKSTVLKIKKQQNLCPPSASCPQRITRVAQVQGVKFACRIANNVKYHIIQELSDNESMRTIASHHHVSVNTVERQLMGLEATFKPNRHWLPATIAFDDFASGKFAQSKMSMILMNPQNHRTIDIIQSRNSHFMRSYFLSHYSKKARWSVKLVVVDLFEPYRNLIHDLFPKAIIIADHFHVVVQAYRPLQSARLKVMKESGPNTHEYRALKHYWKLLMAKEGQLDYLHYYPRRNFRYAWLSNQEVVKRLLNFSSELRAAYEYYQDLITATNQRSQSLLNQLIKQHNLPVTMRRVKRTLTKHRQEIIASFYTQLTNGPIEGTNNKIKVIKRTAYGYRNFFHFRIRILISLKTSNLMSRELSKKRTRPIANVA
ncbi:ISL3 family transposase [Levilactobacillus brevis]|uniref:ISL3 family transposase n=1 Tax=Levilactobacillus brevis TaxID=1580 RepID=UPI0021A8FB84|nr:ISL3 family transposase [Levilactobacillus brevis]MCT3574903.1 ISL3 family transposase [Levilactobacillus brevis]